jgi:hypothetical protein
MNSRHYARIGTALAAAYAVALQAMLLAYGVPLAAAGGIVPICSQAAGHSAAAGQGQNHGQDHGQDCLEACLTGCCSSAPVCPAPAAAAATLYKPALAQVMAPARQAGPRLAARVTAAHRSRAPPLA